MVVARLLHPSRAACPDSRSHACRSATPQPSATASAPPREPRAQAASAGGFSIPPHRCGLGSRGSLQHLTDVGCCVGAFEASSPARARVLAVGSARGSAARLLRLVWGEPGSARHASGGQQCRRVVDGNEHADPLMGASSRHCRRFTWTDRGQRRRCILGRQPGLIPTSGRRRSSGVDSRFIAPPKRTLLPRCVDVPLRALSGRRRSAQ